MNLKKFSEPQKEILSHSNSELTTCLAGGAIRSGKTYSTMIGWVLWTLGFSESRQLALCGQSLSSVMRNVGWDMIDFYNGCGASAHLLHQLGTRIIVRVRPGVILTIWVVGANDINARKRIQGATLAGALIDEVPLIPHDFFVMLWGRLSIEGSKLWCTFNPEGPAHWFKREVVDKLGNYEGKVVHFKIRDNPSLSTKIIERYEGSFEGHWRARLIEGMWAGATGLIFPRWHGEGEALPITRFVLALDWGRASVTTALLFAEHKGPLSTCIGEFYHNAREQEALTEDECLEHLKNFLISKGQSHKGMFIYVDPATPLSFKRLLRRAGFSVRNASNDVLDGISTTDGRLARGEVKIRKSECPNLIRELSSYSWDEKAADAGVDKPIKNDDHCCDVLRYYCFSTSKAFRAFKSTTVKEVFSDDSKKHIRNRAGDAFPSRKNKGTFKIS